MTKAPTTYTEAEIEAQRMMRDAEAILAARDNAFALLQRVRDDIDRLTLPAPQGYKSLGDFLRQQAKDNPNDPTWVSMAMRINRARTEIIAVRDDVIRIINAIEG